MSWSRGRFDPDQDRDEGLGGDQGVPNNGDDDTTQFRALRNRTVLYSMAGRPLNTSLLAYSVSMMPGQDRQSVDTGGKIILPPSCLELLTRLNTTYPMLFAITNPETGRVSHCGVLEFIAEEGRCYIPHWMMLNLGLGEGHKIQIRSVTLPIATFSRFEPQTVDFLQVTSPKAMLENTLRNFACLTTGDTISIPYNGRIYDLRVLETKPGPAVTIIECDMEVDFAPPVGYVEPVYTPNGRAEGSDADDGSQNYAPVQGFRAFGGSGNRLDGKAAQESSGSGNGSAETSSNPGSRRGIPDYDYEVGDLQFMRDFSGFVNSDQVDGLEGSFQPFGGAGVSIGNSNGKKSKIFH